MADLYYYEAGYIDEKYFGYVADAAVDLTTYIEDGYMVSGGECSDVGGIIATYPSAVNKPFIATCKYFPDPYYQTRAYKFFSLVE